VGNFFGNKYIQSQILSCSKSNVNSNLVNVRADWCGSLFDSMISLIRHSTNFKIRINAVHSMTVLPQRGHFSCFQRTPGSWSEDRYFRLWSACVHAFQDSSFSDFSNFKYQETLVLQLLQLLTHLASLSTTDDFSHLQRLLTGENSLEVLIAKVEEKGLNGEHLSNLKKWFLSNVPS